jgi:DNA-binding MurR/RpiR family transcriptional regulator
MALHPPQTLEALRRMYIDIRNGDQDIRLTARALAVLKMMLDAPNETATKSISEIAKEGGMNISSVTRLAQKLGFDGYPGLKEIFRSNLKQRKSFYSEQVKKFLQKDSAQVKKEASLLQRVIQDEWSNVMLMADNFDEQQFAAIVAHIVNGERVHVVGLRSSYPLAHYLAFYLKMIRGRITLLGRAGHTLAEDLSVLKPGDLLIAIGVNPYTRDTLKACRLARQQKVDIVAITDSLSSPLASETDNYLMTAIHGDYFFSPIVSAIICIETLLSEVVHRLGEKAIRRLNHTESVLEKLGVEIQTENPDE